MSQKLGDVISGHGLEFGSTPAGKAWCKKALHPSDATVEMVGVPDGNAMPSFVQNFQQNFIIQAPPGLAENQSWDFDLVLFQHPTHFGYAVRYNPSTGSSILTFFDNVQIGEGFAADQTLQMYYNRYRMAYGSLTLYHDAPALRNQGTLIGVQYPLMTREINLTATATPLDADGKKREEERLVKISPCGKKFEIAPPTYEGDTAPMNVVEPAFRARHVVPEGEANWAVANLRFPFFTAPAIAFVEEPKTFQVLQNMPNAYIGLAREGGYFPMKMTSKHKWFNSKDIRFVLGMATSSNALVQAQGEGTSSANTNNIMQVAAAPNYLGMAGAREAPFGLVSPTGTQLQSNLLEQYTVKRCGDTILHIAGRNVDSSARFVAYLRYGFEFQVYPGSLFASFMKTPPLYDEIALKSYSVIASSLKDGYPADFNDLGTLFGVIKKAAQTVLPVIAPMLGPLAPVAQGVGAILNGYDAFNRKTAGKEVVVQEGKLVTRNARGNRPPAARVQPAPVVQAAGVSRAQKRKQKVKFPTRTVGSVGKQKSGLDFLDAMGEALGTQGRK